MVFGFGSYLTHALHYIVYYYNAVTVSLLNFFLYLNFSPILFGHDPVQNFS